MAGKAVLKRECVPNPVARAEGSDSTEPISQELSCENTRRAGGAGTGSVRPSAASRDRTAASGGSSPARGNTLKARASSSKDTGALPMAAPRPSSRPARVPGPAASRFAGNPAGPGRKAGRRPGRSGSRPGRCGGAPAPGCGGRSSPAGSSPAPKLSGRSGSREAQVHPRSRARAYRKGFNVEPLGLGPRGVDALTTGLGSPDVGQDPAAGVVQDHYRPVAQGPARPARSRRSPTLGRRLQRQVQGGGHAHELPAPRIAKRQGAAARLSHRGGSAGPGVPGARGAG